MSVYSQNQVYKNIIVNGAASDIASLPVFAADFKTVVLDISVDAAADFEIAVYRSDNVDNKNLPIPPNVNLPQSTLNEYEEVSYTDPAGTTYGPGTNRFNPSTGAVKATYSFNVETTGAKWFCIAIRNYAAGTLYVANIVLFSNFA